MPTPAHYASDPFASFEERSAEPDFGMLPGERVGAPLQRRRGRMLGRGVGLLALIGAGWVHYENPAFWPDAWGVASSLWHEISAKPAPTGTPQGAPSRLPDSKAREAAAEARAPARASEVQAPVNAAALAAVAPPEAPAVRQEEPPATNPAPAPEAAAEGPPEPLPPPVASDPLQKRALAAGLHPDLSRALLEKLSDTDYRNAQAAVRAALALPAADAVHVYPAERKGRLAQFRVHFVPGAPQDCRRYVVTVAKDGWLTTALPMERCGISRPAAKRV